MVVRRDERGASFGDYFCDYGFAFVACGAREDDVCAVGFGAGDFGGRGDGGHYDVGGDGVGGGGQGEGLGVVSWEGWLDDSLWLMLHMLVGWSKRTTTMRRNALLPHTLNPLLLNQSPQRIKRASSFEGSDPLLVLAFEE